MTAMFVLLTQMAEENFSTHNIATSKCDPLTRDSGICDDHICFVMNVRSLCVLDFESLQTLPHLFAESRCCIRVVSISLQLILEPLWVLFLRRNKELMYQC